jgi:hypothetical protein
MKTLIIDSDSAPAIFSDIVKADLYIILWHDTDTFTICKNRYGMEGSTIHIPMKLLSNVILNPYGNFFTDWK